MAFPASTVSGRSPRTGRLGAVAGSASGAGVDREFFAQFAAVIAAALAILGLLLLGTVAML